jgi:outer membrane receptor protein involved in Fe transport
MFSAAWRAMLMWWLALCMVGMSVAQSPKVYDIGLPAQSVADALNGLSAETDVPVVFPYDLVRGRSANPVSGRYTLLEALDVLLKNTGLSGGLSDKGVLTISESKSGTNEYRETIVTANEKSTNTNKPRAAHALRAAALIATMGAGLPVAAEEANSDQTAMADVIVTAQKKGEERLQEVPVPISVLSADVLAGNGQTLLRDYYSAVPALNISPNFAGQQMLSIRGVTTGGFTNPVVGVLLDDVPYGSSTFFAGNQVPDIDPGDLARVEVLRGPQGTLYGSNGMGGVLRFVTIDPSTDSYSGRVELGTNYVRNGAQPGFNLRGSANLPIGEDLAVRISGFTRQDPGYIDNPVQNTKGVNWGETTGARLAALWQPLTDFSLKLTALYQRALANGSSDVDAQPGLGDLQQNYIHGIGGYDRKIQAYSAVVHASFGGVNLTSITGYGVNNYEASLDFSSVFGSLVQGAYGVGGSAYIDRDNITKFSQELRFSGTLLQNLDWLAGGFYTHENAPDFEIFTAQVPETGRLVDNYWYLPVPSRFEEGAVFADLTWRFTDQFDIQVGGRESRDTVTQLANTQTGLFVGTPVFTPEYEAKENTFTYLVTPRFKLTPDVMVYARLASGYRPGGPNPSPSANVPRAYKSDKTQNYEIGLKGDFFDRHLTVDTSVYYIDWKDIQIQRTDVLTFNTNGSRAKSEGVELSVTARPMQGFSVAGWVAYDDAVLTEAFPPGPAYGVSGDRLPNTSKWSGNLSLEQDFPLGADATGYLAGVVSYVGDRKSVFTGTASRQDLPAYAKTDLRAGVSWNSWTANVYANNVTDRRGLLNGGIGFNPSFAYVYIPPRTVGVNLVKKF